MICTHSTSARAKRVAKQSSTSSSDTSVASTVSTFDVGSSKGPSAFGLQDHSWPSIATTDTEVTTPSLCSDNENDEVAREEANLPPTPPRRPPTPPRRLKRLSQESHLPPKTPDADDARLPEIIDVDAEPNIIESPQAITPRVERFLSVGASSSPEDVFAKRPPSSPMPKITPKKPLPPARIRRVVSKSQTPPEANAADAAGASPVVRAPTKPHNPLSSISASPRKKKTKKSPVKQQLLIQPVIASSDTPHARRRRALDAELRRAGDHLWGEADDLDGDLLVASGVRDNHGGFLARGGGAGSPVFMGSGYVQGYDELVAPTKGSKIPLRRR